MTLFNCRVCNNPPVLTDGRAIYPHRPDLHDKPMWRCETCPDTYVGCHPGTTNALGFPAGPELRKARSLLHDHRIDPLWRRAPETCGERINTEEEGRIVQKLARGRVYSFLAKRMGIEKEACHTALFTIEDCRRAWVELGPFTYPEIIRWAQTGKMPAPRKTDDTGKAANAAEHRERKSA